MSAQTLGERFGSEAAACEALCSYASMSERIDALVARRDERRLSPKDQAELDELVRERADLLGPLCIAPVVVDGGTRFRANFGERLEQAAPEFRRVLMGLRVPRTREDEAADRKAGGRVVDLPLRQVELGRRNVTARVQSVGGARMESITLYVADVVWFRFNVETGDVFVQFKAKELWASGYERVADRWFDLLTWWFAGRGCSLAQAKDVGWVTTGLELCSDFVGLPIADIDPRSFVGFKVKETIREYGHAETETINFGTRASNISLCLYHKDRQLADAKPLKDGGTGGDDSCYRRLHLAHDWDGISERSRIEFRLANRGLEFVCEETGEVLDLRDPAALANRETLRRVWAVCCSKKRIVLPEASTRLERCKMDPRWRTVLEAAELPLQDGWRQTRQAQTDAWTESIGRAKRDMWRSVKRLAALCNQTDAEPADVLQLMQHITDLRELVDLHAYGKRYRALREEFMGEEIREHGQALWDEVHRRPASSTDSPETPEETNPGRALIEEITARKMAELAG